MVARAFGCGATWRPCAVRRRGVSIKKPWPREPNLRLQHERRREIRRRNPIELDRAPAGEREQHVAVGGGAGGEGLAREVEAVAFGAAAEAVDLVVAGANEEDVTVGAGVAGDRVGPVAGADRVVALVAEQDVGPSFRQAGHSQPIEDVLHLLDRAR
jgi:hypothetical protein